MNGTLKHSSAWWWNNQDAFVETLNPIYINAGTDSFNLQITEQNNKLDIYCFSGDPTYMYIYSLVITVTTYSK